MRWPSVMQSPVAASGIAPSRMLASGRPPAPLVPAVPPEPLVPPPPPPPIPPMPPAAGVTPPVASNEQPPATDASVSAITMRRTSKVYHLGHRRGSEANTVYGIVS